MRGRMVSTCTASTSTTHAGRSGGPWLVPVLVSEVGTASGSGAPAPPMPALNLMLCFCFIIGLTLYTLIYFDMLEAAARYQHRGNRTLEGTMQVTGFSPRNRSQLGATSAVRPSEMVAPHSLLPWCRICQILALTEKTQ